MSLTLADQLKVKKSTLNMPLGLQLAMQEFQSQTNLTTEARLQYQSIDAQHHFNIINLNSHYDIILGTPWLYQPKVCVGLNPARIIIGQEFLELIQSVHDTKLILDALTKE
jgi:Retroviral aspartyl protease